MNSFKDIDGKDVSFESKSDLELELQRDIISKEITAYLVCCNGCWYKVTKTVFEALDEMR